MHRRTKQGIAWCGIPAKQEHLTDDVQDVDCPACWLHMRAAART